MYSPFVLLFLLSALFSLCSAVKQVEKITKIECGCDPESNLDVTTSPPFIHPYDQYGNIDKPKIRQLCTLYETAGIKGLSALSPQSGSAFLTYSKKVDIVDTLCANKKATGFPKTLLCQANGINYNQTLELTRYFKKSCCDAIVTSAPITYPLMNTYQIANYAKGVANACYPKPLLYADLLFPSDPYNPAKLFKLLTKIKNFVGMRSSFESLLLVKSVNDVSKYYLISDSSENTAGPRFFCINGTTTLIATVFPEIIVQIEEAFTRGDYERAVELQENLTSIFVEAVGLSKKPERYDRTSLIYVLNVVVELLNVTKGIDVGKNPVSEQLSNEDKQRISQLSRRECLTYNPNDNEEDYAKNDFNEYEEEANKKYPYEKPTTKYRNSNKGTKNKYPSYSSGKKNMKYPSQIDDAS